MPGRGDVELDHLGLDVDVAVARDAPVDLEHPEPIRVDLGVAQPRANLLSVEATALAK